MAVGELETVANTRAARIYSKVTAYCIVAAQIVTGLSLAGGLLIITGQHAAYSALAGCAIGVVPSFYLVRRVFNVAEELAPVKMLMAFYIAEAIKIALTVALFLIAIIVLDIHILFLFGGYLATILVYWFGLLLPEPTVSNSRL